MVETANSTTTNGTSSTGSASEGSSPNQSTSTYTSSSSGRATRNQALSAGTASTAGGDELDSLRGDSSEDTGIEQVDGNEIAATMTDTRSVDAKEKTLADEDAGAEDRIKAAGSGNKDAGYALTGVAVGFGIAAIIAIEIPPLAAVLGIISAICGIAGGDQIDKGTKAEEAQREVEEQNSAGRRAVFEGEDQNDAFMKEQLLQPEQNGSGAEEGIPPEDANSSPSDAGVVSVESDLNS
ncbi:MAG: hypothetical protein A3G32_04040 [Deltaproteobacteria bacterium RIFCSPLOWO2_12_FULL_40_28]|nr:MAG: hypothetical protein A3C45_06125 [Deltaproteobacteria bacterium RIFCSPHIGHO2_02_FULL_40_28]OGQ20492.1 MAG: hypothetical protein A3E27_01920 [Deltaproteobacteria bacterium RIFCSPHIGHO2_12_FULL_40_32]OGQ41122.1 MAG: hypothetical protein A3I69_08785 [Deltaproteobacteria bacterium RIFCSPLOWO2_02_FULL_40_36]OGQ55102.1 MAG: hypothetical protein A3G32_04040 [Deltaproteobacteria bacterium RIFCSPLOWO2_12_FULL_40_28]